MMMTMMMNMMVMMMIVTEYAMVFYLRMLPEMLRLVSLLIEVTYSLFG